MNLIQYAGQYRDNLLNDVIPFWLKHSIDEEFGGYYTCLGREGKVFDTDKFIWLQGRQVWTFSMLCNRLGMREEWLRTAEHGADFLLRHGRDANRQWYFSLTREGRPLIQAYNIFSDCFAAMAFAQLGKATGSAEYNQLALDTFQNILTRFDKPKGNYSKAVPGTRPLKGLSLPMILSNLVLEVEHVLPAETVDSTIRECVRAVMEDFYDPATGLIMENVTPDGRLSDSFDGRLVSPGHSLESMWFLMDIAHRLKDEALMRRCTDVALNMLEFGWDEEFGGIFYFMDAKGRPPQQLEWDQKLWWVHHEAIVAMLKGYRYTGDERCLAWFKRLHDYTWKHFHDPEFGEWFGYLNRRGEVLLPLKGGKWKGCFHVPRSLFLSWKTLEEIAVSQTVTVEP